MPERWTVSNERHVDLDEFGLELDKAGEARITSTEVVHGKPIAERAQPPNAVLQSGDLVKPSSLRHLQNDSSSMGR